MLTRRPCAKVKVILCCRNSKPRFKCFAQVKVRVPQIPETVSKRQRRNMIIKLSKPTSLTFNANTKRHKGDHKETKQAKPAFKKTQNSRITTKTHNKNNIIPLSRHMSFLAPLYLGWRTFDLSPGPADWSSITAALYWFGCLFSS